MISRRALLICLALILIGLWLLNVTTPAECRVPVEQMSQFCKDLLYP